MSGVKGATVRNNLNKVVRTVNAGVAECERAAAEAGEVGRTECTRHEASARKVHDGVRRALPAELREFLRGETGQWEALLRRHDESFAAANGLVGSANDRESEFQSRKRACDARLAQIGGAVRRIQATLQGKDWYCDAENAEAKDLRRQAEQVLSEMRRNVSLGRQAQELRRQSVSRFSESESLARDAEREYNRLVNLAGERQERQRIKEENERKAKNLESDISSLRGQIESKNYAKFGGDVYTSAVRREMEDVLRLIGNRAYEKALPRAEALKGVLGAAAAQIDAAQRAWETERLTAERTLADAREEVGKLDRDDLVAFSGVPADEINGCYGSIDAAAREIAAERFADASAHASAAVGRLREIGERAAENRKLSEQREEMAQAIMQALYDAKYDTPSYYMQDEADNLSDLCVVAAAPGGVGDMRMRIGISGETKFEVGNIPEGSEQLCIDQIRNLQKRLAESDVRFDMTDWGRADNQNKVHLDVRQKQTTVQQTVQRQG